MSQEKISEGLNKVITRYIQTLKKDNLPMKSVFLFGSYAKGYPHRDSDVDLCVVSPKFTDYVDAIQYLLSKRDLDLKYPIEPIGITPKAFLENTGLTKEIKKTGIKVYP